MYGTYRSRACPNSNHFIPRYAAGNTRSTSRSAYPVVQGRFSCLVRSSRGPPLAKSQHASRPTRYYRVGRRDLFPARRATTRPTATGVLPLESLNFCGHDGIRNMRVILILKYKCIITVEHQHAYIRNQCNFKNPTSIHFTSSAKKFSYGILHVESAVYTHSNCYIT